MFPREQIPAGVALVATRLRERGFRTWAVGGCVRDALLGKAVDAWDLATDARPEQVIATLETVVPSGSPDAVTVMLAGGHCRVATLRAGPGRGGERGAGRAVYTDDIARDLARRDFTMNAIAVDLESGALVDPWGGARDIGARVIRAVGEAKARFSEDGLRALRAARYAATLEFDVDPGTLAAIPTALDAYARVPAERVRDEWLEAMQARSPSRAFEVMAVSGMLGHTCPELLEGIGMRQNSYHAFDVWGHAMACLDACVGDPVLRIAALLHDVGKPRTRAFSEKTQDYTFYDHDRVGAEICGPICSRLRFPDDERARITTLVRHHLFHYTDEWTDAAVRRWMRRVGVDRLDDLYALNEADARGKGTGAGTVEASLLALERLRVHVARVAAADSALSTRDLAVNGTDLMRELGLEPGPGLGRVLNELLEAVRTDPDRNARDTLLEEARRIVVQSFPR